MFIKAQPYNAAFKSISTVLKAASETTAPPLIPPYLYRKETLITADYPLYPTFAWLPQQEVLLGLLDNPQAIGLRRAWQKRLAEHRLMIYDHHLACPLVGESKPTPVKPTVHRHRADRPPCHPPPGQTDEESSTSSCNK